MRHARRKKNGIFSSVETTFEAPVISPTRSLPLVYCGQVVKVGAGDIASAFAEGAVVGVGWHGDHCLSCEACSDGDFVCCRKQKATGIHIHGGYQE